jgi:hypothetical protein
MGSGDRVPGSRVPVTVYLTVSKDDELYWSESQLHINDYALAPERAISQDSKLSFARI